MSEDTTVELTIVTVTKNCRDLLQKTYESLASQSSQIFDWVLVDAYSQDGTRELISNISKERKIEIVDREPNGIYDAMNVGARGIQTGWLWFLNAGDVLLSNDSINRILKFLELADHQDCVAFPVAHLTPSGFLYQISIPQQDKDHFRIHHQGAFIRAEKFHSLGGYDINLKWASDGKLLDAICQSGDILVSKNLEIGFEIGGASARNYRNVLLETLTYRKPSHSPSQTIFLKLKNLVKLAILDSATGEMAWFVAQYYSRRQSKLLSDPRLKNMILSSNNEIAFRKSQNLKF